MCHSRYYKGTLTQKRLVFVLCTTFKSDFHVSWNNQNKHSTLNSSFDALSKWNDPHIIVEIETIWFSLNSSRIFFIRIYSATRLKIATAYPMALFVTLLYFTFLYRSKTTIWAIYINFAVHLFPVDNVALWQRIQIPIFNRRSN